MADIKMTLPGRDGGDRDGSGACGEEPGESRRGPRGPSGPPGTNGTNGTTGPTGTSGSMGSTGATGPSGTSAYGYAVNDVEQEFEPNTDVRFNLGGTPFPNVGITVPAPGGSAFVVLSGGDYEYNFYVAAHNIDTPTTTALEFAIFLNGASSSPAHEFQSNHQGPATSADDLMVVRGQGIISLGAGTIVTLRNRTGGGTEKPVAVANAPGGEQCANATLSLKKLSP